tara:strand:+ start:183 stop:332 length:150 start_codon:yes stop_codon:yes gene_type:complete
VSLPSVRRLNVITADGVGVGLNVAVNVGVGELVKVGVTDIVGVGEGVLV